MTKAERYINLYLILNQSCKRLVDTYTADYIKGMHQGIYNSIYRLILREDISEDDFPELVRENTKINPYLSLAYTFKFLDKNYEIYYDDAGQCYALKIDNEYLGFGAYCEVDRVELLCFILDEYENLINNDLFRIKEEEHYEQLSLDLFDDADCFNDMFGWEGK